MYLRAPSPPPATRNRQKTTFQDTSRVSADSITTRRPLSVVPVDWPRVMCAPLHETPMVGQVPDAGWTEGDEPPMPREAMLMGDFNFVPDSDQYDTIAGPVSPNHGRLTRRDGLLDAWVIAGHGENDRVTSPAVANDSGACRR